MEENEENTENWFVRRIAERGVRARRFEVAAASTGVLAEAAAAAEH